MTFTPKLVLAALALTLGAMTPASAAGELPPAPDILKKAGVLKAGVKCDYPPDGFLDAQGKPQGIEVNMAKQVAAYALGDASKVELACVTAANRIPMLTGGKVDMLIATLGISEERAKVIDFSDPYAWGASDVLVLKDSPVKKLAEFKGKTVIVLKGAWQIGWFEKNLPEVNLLKLDNVSDGLQALMQGRGDGYAHDFAVLVGIAKNNPKARLVGEFYQIGFRGAGFRKGETALREYVNAAMKKAYVDGLVAKWVKDYVEPDLQQVTIDTWNLAKQPKAD